jgi:mRNA interferase MazF
VIIAPLTSVTHPYPFRVTCRFAGRQGQVVTDQIRTVDRERLVRRLGKLTNETRLRVLAVLQEMFAP